jgi:hypothetical protein
VAIVTALVAIFTVFFGILAFRMVMNTLSPANADSSALVTPWSVAQSSLDDTPSATDAALTVAPAASLTMPLATPVAAGATPTPAATATLGAAAANNATPVSVSGATPTQPGTVAPSETAPPQSTGAPTSTPAAGSTATAPPTSTSAAAATAGSPVPPTSTAVATSQPTQATPGSTSVPTSTQAATAGPTPVASGDWSFSGLRLHTAELDQGVSALFGDFVNNSGHPETLKLIRGTFYDADGRTLDTQDSTAFWPLPVVPPGSRVPFMMFAALVPQAVAKYDLEIEAEPSDQAPAQDFQFSGVQVTPGTETYCLEGQVSHPGAALKQDAEIVVVLYDSQGNVINFGTLSPDLKALAGGQPIDFNICVPSFGLATDHYDLNAWGW